MTFSRPVFEVHFGSKTKPKTAPKATRNLSKFLFFSGLFLFEVLEVFGCILGGLVGFLRDFWQAFGPQKHRKTVGFSWFWGNISFCCFGGLDGSSGAVWASSKPFWGPKMPPKRSRKWPKNSSRIDPKKGPEKDLEMTPKWSPKSTKDGEFFGAFWGSFPRSWPRELRLTTRWPQRVPRWPKTGPRQGKHSPKWFKL